MRYLVTCAIGLTMAALSAAGQSRGVTVLLDFRGEASPDAVSALQGELNRLLKPAGIDVGYHIGSELGPAAEPTDIIVVKFRGRCRRDGISPVPDEHGPFARTHVSNGQILPFAEVACDRVQSSMRTKVGPRITEAMLGRALARVVAHELYHIVGKTPHHSDEGIARRGLSSSDLVAESLAFAGHDLRKMHTP
ncbi:MAG TPA: hypothetical protein VES20_07390 [Bryobacteraceae bacterium]|nr:hypothetical protein [Bryobacteraceae bacterium]